MPLSLKSRWLPLLIPLALIGVWLALGLVPHLAGGAPPGGSDQPRVLIEAEELKALIDKKDPALRIIDFRHKAKYYLGHVPGAIQLWRSETEDQHPPSAPLPAAHLESLLGRLGIGSSNTLIIYSDHCDHARLWWLLAHYGFPLSQMRLLDGGYEAWKAKGYPTQLTSPRFKTTSFRFPADDRNQTLLATQGDVKGAEGKPNKVIVDVRPPRLYLGEVTKEGAARPGHIPGAVDISWEENLVASGPFKGHWKSPAELREIYVSRGVTPDKDIYLYGHDDHCATFSLLSLYLAGYPLEKLHVYGGSWVEWSRSREPVVKGPAR